MHEIMKHIVKVSTNIGESCEHCSEQVGVGNFTSGVNHYMDAHGYKLLHVGQESEHSPDGGLWHSTVAVLGKEDTGDQRPVDPLDIGDITANLDD